MSLVDNHASGQNATIEQEEHRHVNGVNAKAVVPYGLSGTDLVPMTAEDVMSKYRIADEDSAGATKYYGFTTIAGKWYIMQNNSSAGTYRYTNGSASYATNYSNRASLTYDYLFNLTGL